MRIATLLAAGALAGAAVLGTAAPAAAYCDPLYERLFDTCTNNCYIMSAVYTEATGDAPPWGCPD